MMTEVLRKPIYVVAATSILAAFCLGIALPSSAKPPVASPPIVLADDNPGVLMRGKLIRSKEILEGLLRNDFRSISRAAQEMKRISEMAEWPRERDNVYERFSAEFRRQCTELESLAEDLNREGVKFTYLNMTTTCINCHDYIRDSRRIAGAGHEGDVRFIAPHGAARVVR